MMADFILLPKLSSSWRFHCILGNIIGKVYLDFDVIKLFIMGWVARGFAMRPFTLTGYS